MSYQGWRKYVDRELAQRVIELDPDMLRWVLSGLLEPDVIDYTVERLDILKQHLLEHEDKWLEPDEWEVAINSGDIFEDEEAYLNTSKHGYKAFWD